MSLAGPHTHWLGFPGSSNGKESAHNAGDLGSVSVGKIPWRREWQPTPAFLSGEAHGQRSLAGYSPCGRKESDTTERLTLFTTYPFRACGVGTPSPAPALGT